MLVQFYTAIIESIFTSSITMWYAGPLPGEACWGRGVSEYEDECIDEMFRSDGKVIFTRPSGRYHFTGNIAEGDAAMTIMDVNEDDSGYYFCLVKGIGIYQLFKWDVEIEGPPREAVAPSSIQTAPTPIMATTPSTANETKSETTIVVASTVTPLVLVMLTVALAVTPLVLVMLTVALAATWYIKTRTGGVNLVARVWSLLQEMRRTPWTGREPMAVYSVQASNGKGVEFIRMPYGPFKGP
ncbi:hepatitis A virus cellular receptor 1 homolog [Dunckerocampus dactyliophorus]|uniref:hepatitis A virus cellular receptor 1 homolog n=1 Tax=Dunckerocampus dactyliophorus TaxID=161453 RepID=UPI00240666DD|nr:hepatitis A virus cellular receptor 1 homolog [Dunckerocampus dactyliophorus]